MAVLADKVDRTWLLGLLIVLAIIPAMGLVVAGTFAALVTLTIVLGLTTSVIAPIFYTLLADRFGLANFGTVRGIMAPVTAIMGAVGLRFIGEMHDATGNYDLGFRILAGVAIAASILMLASRRIACR